MHFWINKSSQGYGYNRRVLCSGGGFYPDSMVTPVHRFQSIESVANNGHRSNRQAQTYCFNSYPSYQARRSPHCSRSAEQVASPTTFGNSAPAPQNAQSSTAHARGVTTPQRPRGQTTCFKCGVWFFFSMFLVFFAGVKAYIHGFNIGVEAIVFCLFLALVLVVGGFVSLCEAVSNCGPGTPPVDNFSTIETAEPTQSEDSQTGMQSTATMQNAELPPPPYHIAVMLSPTNNVDLASVQVIRDSPPPSYEKAVT